MAVAPADSRSGALGRRLKELLSHAGQWYGDTNLALSDRFVPGPTLPEMQPFSVNDPKVHAFTSPAFQGGEGFQTGSRIYVGPERNPVTIAHELEHVAQTRRYGLLYDPIYQLLDRLYGGYERHPFERAAVKAGDEARAAALRARYRRL